MTSLKSQALGLLLGLATAVGCIFYEKIVHAFSYTTFIIIFACELLLLGVVGSIVFPNQLVQDYHKFTSDSKYWIWAGIYILTGITSLLWYKITRSQGVMVGSIYEVKYIVIMALIYIIFGENRFTINTAIGVTLAMGSIYFISK
jgi:drug/metabolite transporter (DMT)-like permease